MGLVLVEAAKSGENFKSDLDFIYFVRNHPEIRKNLIHPEEISYKDHIKWYCKKYANSTDICIYKMIISDNNTSIGYCDIKYDRYDRTAELGFKILPNFQRQGYGSLCIPLLFDKLGVYKNNYMIFLTVFEDNVEAVRLYRRFGFSTYYRDFMVVNGEARTLLHMSLNSLSERNT